MKASAQSGLRARIKYHGAFWAAASLLVIAGCEGSSKQVSQYSGQYTGADPHAFVDTENMLKQERPWPYDENAARLVEQVTAALTRDERLESDAVWQNLRGLNQYRTATEIQRAVEEWAIVAARQNWAPGFADFSMFLQTNMLYRQQKFWEASDRFRAIVQQQTGHHDARSNLALCELHLNFDLTAQVELETLLRMKPDYLPALMNLTVVCERLGQEEKAAALARRADELSDYQGAQYNAAWFANLRGDFQAAEQLLHPLAEMDVRPSHARLHELNARQAGIHSKLNAAILSGPSAGGLAAGINPGASRGRGFVLMGAFLVASVLLVAIAAFGRYRVPRAEGVVTLVLVLILTVGYLLFWGWPSGMGWMVWALYVLCFSAMSGVRKARY